MYLFILKPLFLANISFKSNRACIGDVIPKQFNFIHILKKNKQKVNTIGQQFIDLLIDEF